MTPDPGIYYDVSNEDYHSWDGVLSKSRLWQMVTSVDRDGTLHLSPGKFKHAMESPPPPKDAYKIGAALDCKLLEPQDFEQRYIMAKSCEAPARKGSDEVCGKPGRGMIDGQWRCGVHGGNDADIPPECDLLTHIEMAEVRAMSRSIMAHPQAGQLFKRPHKPQVAVVGQLFGELFKGRFDMMAENHIIDLKTSRAPWPNAFQRQIREYGYHVQAFAYLTMAAQANAIHWPDAKFSWLTVGKSPIYGCGSHAAHPVYLYTVKAASPMIEVVAKDHAMELIATYQECMESGNWPDTLDETVIDLDTLNEGETYHD